MDVLFMIFDNEMKYAIHKVNLSQKFKISFFKLKYNYIYTMNSETDLNHIHDHTGYSSVQMDRWKSLLV